jgi:hypothetical protein
MTKFDKQWNMNYEKLVQFKRIKGHCMVPQIYKQDKSLGKWVAWQRTDHKKNKIGLDRKRLLDEIGFVWKIDGWRKKYEQLLEFKRTNGHCLVPQMKKGDASFGWWVKTQRKYHTNNKLLPDRKRLLDEIGFVWKAVTGRARASTTDVRVLVIHSFHPLKRLHCSLSLFFCLTLLCRIRNRQR